MHRFYVSVIALASLPLIHCMLPLQPVGANTSNASNQGASDDPSSQAGASETTAAGMTPSAPRNATPSAKAAGPSAPLPTRVEIHSDCPKTVSVFYGDKPKFGSGTKSSVSSNSTSSQGRKSDGTLVVWLIDEHENGIASVHVAPSTKRVEIDRSCKQISAR